jgi:tRNA(Ile)-lysidine synthase
VSELANRVEENIRRQGLFRRGERILVAVSGGTDSMVMLDVLRELAPKHGWELTVAHLNHRLRGRSSDADERLVRQTAARSTIEVVAESADVRAFARKHGISLEMAARKLRHDFLARTAARLKIRKISLAHHADDQLELFFLRLFRGAGVEGLAGMQWHNPSPSEPRIELTRPLLDQPKAALRAYAKERRVKFREDATNASLDIQRNRIRHELLPLLRRSYQPTLDRTVLRVMEILRAEAEFVSQAAAQWVRAGKLCGVPIAFDQLPVAIQRRSLLVQLTALRAPADYDLIEALRTRPETPVALSRREKADPAAHETLSAFRDRAGMVHLRTPDRLAFGQSSLNLDLEKRGKAEFSTVVFRWQSKPSQGRLVLKVNQGQELLDADKVGSPIYLRHWQPGDRFQPIGMHSAVKLQDFFTNRKVPRRRRRELVLGVTAKGEVFWVEGMRISERFKLTEGTKRCLQWRWKRL